MRTLSLILNSGWALVFVILFKRLINRGQPMVNFKFMPDVQASGKHLAEGLKNLAMKKGDKVAWNWGKSQASGTIEKKHVEPVKKTIKGTAVKRNASKENPAYEIAMEAGKKALKSESELKPDK